MRMQRAGSPGRARAALTALEHLLACARPAALGASPYERYPALLPSLLALLASEQYAAHPRTITTAQCDGGRVPHMGRYDASRSSVARVLGILGALEPLKYRTAIARARQTHEAKHPHQLLGGDGGGPHAAAKHPHHGHAAGPRATQAQASFDTAQSVAVGALGAGAGTLGLGAGAVPGWRDELSPTAPQHLAAVALWEARHATRARPPACVRCLLACVVPLLRMMGDATAGWFDRAPASCSPSCTTARSPPTTTA